MDEKRVGLHEGGVRPPRLSPDQKGGGSDSPHVPPKGKSLPKELWRNADTHPHAHAPPIRRLFGWRQEEVEIFFNAETTNRNTTMYRPGRRLSSSLQLSGTLGGDLTCLCDVLRQVQKRYLIPQRDFHPDKSVLWDENELDFVSS